MKDRRETVAAGGTRRGKLGKRRLKPLVAHHKITDGGRRRAWRGAREVENVLWVSGSVTLILSVRGVAVPLFAGEPKFGAYVPPPVKTRADTGCVEIIAAMIPKTTPLFCHPNPKYNRDCFKA
jgi:hypothetical protein